MGKRNGEYDLPKFRHYSQNVLVIMGEFSKNLPTGYLFEMSTIKPVYRLCSKVLLDLILAVLFLSPSLTSPL